MFIILSCFIKSNHILRNFDFFILKLFLRKNVINWWIRVLKCLICALLLIPTIWVLGHVKPRRVYNFRALPLTLRFHLVFKLILSIIICPCHRWLMEAFTILRTNRLILDVLIVDWYTTSLLLWCQIINLIVFVLSMRLSIGW